MLWFKPRPHYASSDRYGFGWRLQAGSITPFWLDWAVHHYTFIDSTGAEYRLDVNTNGIWTSREGIYVEYDPFSYRLYFPDGSFWVMGAASAGTEQDAGTRYPTVIQDRPLSGRAGRELGGLERPHQ